MVDTIKNVAQLLYRAVKKAAVSPDTLEIGDLIIITGSTDDIVGIVDNLEDTNNVTNITLHTATGLQSIKVSDKNFIHLIKKADMLNLRKHTDYERDLKDMTKEKGYKERPEFGPVTDSEKSVLPTSKVSLNLRRTILKRSK